MFIRKKELNGYEILHRNLFTRSVILFLDKLLLSGNSGFFVPGL